MYALKLLKCITKLIVSQVNDDIAGDDASCHELLSVNLTYLTYSLLPLSNTYFNSSQSVSIHFTSYR